MKMSQLSATYEAKKRYMQMNGLPNTLLTFTTLLRSFMCAVQQA